MPPKSRVNVIPIIVKISEFICFGLLSCLVGVDVVHLDLERIDCLIIVEIPNDVGPAFFNLDINFFLFIVIDILIHHLCCQNSSRGGTVDRRVYIRGIADSQGPQISCRSHVRYCVVVSVFCLVPVQKVSELISCICLGVFSPLVHIVIHISVRISSSCGSIVLILYRVEKYKHSSIFHH